ncbi:PKD domain containing protein [Methanolacinia petrolearia DSM 11571]|uniref:PKD domain containing protein n=1 Tax=Methanolacinia petrolearia (strain DSM 11571 / OCM 486 / SEBR 4847) TaxID=679926 RepID=E1RDP0_METP4|nr:PKD domain-containing protein [Methanolacinia petrolearia]ADN35993.1 PKD domain containing protein [Methanolacinia petrolearia DSM 11571]
MNYKRNIISALFALLLTCLLIVIPAAAIEPAFDWQVYRINTDDWTSYTDYLSYSGTIYEVHFTDKTTNGTPISWDWEFSEDDWWGSSEQNPVHIYTEDEADDADYRFKVKLSVMDSSGNYEETENTVYVVEDAWNLNDIIDLTPEPTATPTPVPTTAPPTTVATTIPTTPTPEPTPVPSFSLKVPVISNELSKLKAAYEDHLEVILQIFRNIGILKD